MGPYSHPSFPSYPSPCLHTFEYGVIERLRVAVRATDWGDEKLSKCEL